MWIESRRLGFKEFWEGGVDACLEDVGRRLGLGLPNSVPTMLGAWSLSFLDIQDLPFRHDLCVKRLSLFKPPGKIAGRADEEVHREWCRDIEANTDRLVVLITSRHDHENVHIAVRMGFPPRIRAE